MFRQWLEPAYMTNQMMGTWGTCGHRMRYLSLLRLMIAQRPWLLCLSFEVAIKAVTLICTVADRPSAGIRRTIFNCWTARFHGNMPPLPLMMVSAFTYGI